jgi:hypothetical protein
MTRTPNTGNGGLARTAGDRTQTDIAPASVAPKRATYTPTLTPSTPVNAHARTPPALTLARALAQRAIG